MVARTPIRSAARRLKDDKTPLRPRIIAKESDSSQSTPDKTLNFGESGGGHTVSKLNSSDLEMQERPGLGPLMFLLRQIQGSTSLSREECQSMGGNNNEL